MTETPPTRLPSRQIGAHKGDFGRVLLIGGSRGMSGSIAMSAIAALRTGSGLVTAAVPDRCLEVVAGFHPCIMTVPMPDDLEGRFSLDAGPAIADRLRGSSAVGVGPGMTTQPGSLRIVDQLFDAASLARVFDADAINCLAMLDWRQRHRDCTSLVLTPHPGELERISGVSARDRDAQIKAAQEISAENGVVFVVKGGPTVVVGPNQTWTNSTGNPGMATAGSGDVLTGVVASLLGQGMSAWDASVLGVWIHGLAGDIAADRLGQPGMTASDILDALPEAVCRAVAAE